MFALGLPASASAAPTSGAKKRRGQEPSFPAEEDKFKAIVPTLAKLSLSSAQQLRKISAAVMWCCQVDAKCELVVAAQAAYAEFVKMSKGLQDATPEQRDQQLGIPSVHMLNAVMGVALKSAELSEEKKKTLTDFQQTIASSSDTKEVLAAHCPVFVIVAPFDKQKRKLEISMSMELKVVWEASILPLLANQKAFRMLRGTAPRGTMEREVQEFLDSIKE